MTIHATAIIDPTARLGADVTIGPYSVVGPHCAVGDGSVLGAHVVLESHTRLGSQCRVASGAVLGGEPQDLHFGGETSWVEVGDRTVIRECVTINRATGEGQITRVGDDCMIMAYTHLAHNCRLGNRVILANSVQLGGYVEVGDYAFISGICAVHQFVKIGRLTIVSGFSGTRQDLPPFATTEGRPQAVVVGINKVGLKRQGFDLEARTRIKKAYQHLFFSKLNLEAAIDAIHRDVGADDPNVNELIEFVKTSKRGIHRLDDSADSEERSPEAAGTV